MDFKEGSWFINYQRKLIETIALITICMAIGIMFRLRFQGKRSNLTRKIFQRHIFYLILFLIELMYPLRELYKNEIDEAINEKYG